MARSTGISDDREASAPKILSFKNQLTILANGFNEALIFVEGEKDQKRYLFFFPGSTLDKGASEERCNNVFKQLTEIMTHPESSVPIAHVFEKRHFLINPESRRGKRKLFCIETDIDFNALIQQLKKFDVVLPARKISCPSINSLEVAKTIERYYNNPKHKLPAELNGVPHEEDAGKFTIRVQRPVTLKNHTIPADKKPDEHTPNPEHLSFVEWVREQSPVAPSEFNTPATRKLQEGFIANPGAVNGGLSLFVPKNMQLDVIRDLIQFSCGLNDKEAAAIAPKKRKQFLVKDKQQIQLSEDWAEGLVEAFSVRMLNDGKPMQVKDIVLSLRNAAKRR